jgi:hypothetical protein
MGGEMGPGVPESRPSDLVVRTANRAGVLLVDELSLKCRYVTGKPCLTRH